MTQLVSVLVPSYNAAATLPWAMASLFAQTYENWEALVVDDGSTDGTANFLNGIRDPRIRYFRNDRNLGRSLSRQRALDAATGAYIAMLDADDWLFPDRIRLQVAALEGEPRVLLVSSGAAIVDARQCLTGVRGLSPRPVVLTASTLALTSVVFATTMFRHSPGLGQRFDPRYSYSEDSDFMIRLLQGHSYLMLPDLGYVYCEHISATVGKMVRSHQCMAKIYFSHRATHPFRSMALASKSALKAGMWAVAGTCGFGDALIGRRSQRPSQQHVKQYLSAREFVGEYAARFGGKPESQTGFWTR